jgi:hypothetical protein
MYQITVINKDVAVMISGISLFLNLRMVIEMKRKIPACSN